MAITMMILFHTIGDLLIRIFVDKMIDPMIVIGQQIMTNIDDQAKR